MNLREQFEKETGFTVHEIGYDAEYIEWLEQRNKEQVEVLEVAKERLVYLNAGNVNWTEINKIEEQLKKSE